MTSRYAAIAFVLVLFAFSNAAQAQIGFNTWGQSGIRIGDAPATTCNSSAEGALKYNSTAKVFQFCNASAWSNMAGAPSLPDRGLQFNSGTSFTASSTLVYTSVGNLGIGTTSPLATLDIAGSIYGRSNSAGSSTSINWALGNLQYTTASCGAFTFTNMQDGGVYTLMVEGTTSGTCSFSQSGLTFKLPPQSRRDDGQYHDGVFLHPRRFLCVCVMGPRLLILLTLLAMVLPLHRAQAQTMPFAAWQSSQWQRNGSTLDLDFTNDRYWLNGTKYTGVVSFISGAGATFTRAGTSNVSATSPFYLDATQGQAFVSRASVTNNVTSTAAPFYIGTTGNGPSQSWVSRASSATYFDSSGTLQTAATNVARSATYSYSAGSWVANTGSLVEPAATNGIRNNTMTGAVAGTTITAQSISSITNSSTLATLTTAAPHGLAVGNIVWVTGASPSVYNGAFVVASVPTSTTLTYSMVSDPGSSASTVGSYTAYTSGTWPTNIGPVSPVGIRPLVVGTGTESGVSYVDIRLIGLPYTAGPQQIALETTTGVPASVGQTWTASLFHRLISGSLATSGIGSSHFTINSFDSSGTGLANSNPGVATPTGAGLSTQRVSGSWTLTGATTAYTRFSYYFTVTIGTPVDITLRIGMPQLEQGTTATSIIATSSAAVTRAADVYNQQPASYVDGTGTLYFSSANTARDNHNASSPYADLGNLVEPAATNSIRNNMMVGAVAADGVERATNGTFSACSGATCTGWTTTVNGGTGSVSFSSGSATLTGDGTNAASIYQAIPTVSGYMYTIAINANSGNTLTVQVGTTAGNSNIYTNSTTGIAVTYFQFTGSGSTAYVQINNSSATPSTITSISVQSAGQKPTNWNISTNNGTWDNIYVQVVGTGTTNGISYVDIKFAGTSSSASQNFSIKTESNNIIAASNGQSWTHSVYVALVGGSTANLTNGISIDQFSSTPAYLSSLTGLSYTPTSTLRRYTNTATTNDASVAYVQPTMYNTFGSGAVINITLR
jgi:hypothetical protein